MGLEPGARLGPYEILSALGAGGMGEVYRARHLKLGRDVAIKVLPSDLASDTERLKRFEREARSASALNHPNIVTIHDIAEHDGTTYMAMELVEGRTLRTLLQDGPPSVGKAIALGSQICEGLGKAHAAGIVHRDLKPDNLMVTGDGLVKILDFGLAKAIPGEAGDGSALTTLSKGTAAGVIVGTAYYMSPEQATGLPVDHRSDQFSFGVVLYELLCGKRPFEGASVPTVIGSILRDEPPPPRSLRPDTPRELERILERCLQKDPGRRYASAGDVRRDLLMVEERAAESKRRRKRRLAVAGLLIAVVAGVAWFGLRLSRAQWARERALPEITRLSDAGEIYEAYRLALEAKKYIPDDARLQETIQRITMPLPVNTKPDLADVYVKGYATPNAPWEYLGRTPISGVGVPYALMRWKIEKEGFETVEFSPFGGGGSSLATLARGLPLEPVGTRPAGMVQVPPGGFMGSLGVEAPGELPAIPVGGSWFDRYEVTNREFKEFVDAGGYERPELWTAPHLDGSEELSWEEAVASFRDATGRMGPSTWELSSFPEGTGDLPVAGVSWYEAAAYCAFAGKSLPTLYHWLRAADHTQLSDIVRFSNFGTDGLAPVGSYPGLGPYGTYDMAGNVKEWCSTATGEGERYILGGAAGDPTYMYGHIVFEEPLARGSHHGFRCARYAEPPAEALLRPVSPASRFGTSSPADDGLFESYLAMYDYDRVDLRATVESVDDSSPYWRRQRVSYTAAYGEERVPALVFLPRNAEPPFQTVVWVPGNDVFAWRSSESLASAYLFDFIPRTGRALVYPIYKGTYERLEPFSLEPLKLRDTIVHWSRELGRTLDYLETRDDIDREKLAYYGFSSGGAYGPIFTAIHPRFAASVLVAGSLWPPLFARPEMDAVNFAPRSRVPTLMINGRDDFRFPYEPFQRPLFDLLGAPEADKRHARLEGGHLPPRLGIIRETLDWLDRYLGPVELQ